jgi:hypothetical protein
LKEKQLETITSREKKEANLLKRLIQTKKDATPPWVKSTV